MDHDRHEHKQDDVLDHLDGGQMSTISNVMDDSYFDPKTTEDRLDQLERRITSIEEKMDSIDKNIATIMMYMNISRRRVLNMALRVGTPIPFDPSI